MSKRTNYSSGAPWESIAGYSRVVRVGNVIEVAGTTAVDAHGKVIGKDDPAEQTRFVLDKIETALQRAGSSLKDVIRTRMYITNMADWKKVTRVHGEFFSDIKPVATLVEVSALIDPDLLIEIEVSAIAN